MTATSTRKIVATYPYTDEQGVALYEVVRYDPKDFLQRRPLADGSYQWNLNGVRRVPYRLPELRDCIAIGHTVIVVEGEKDADALAVGGLCATTNCGGANWHWTPDFVECFRGAKRVVVIPDCDEGDPKKGTTKGREAAQKRANDLRTVCDNVAVLDLDTNKHDGYDVSNWLSDGHAIDELRTLVEAAPLIETTAVASLLQSSEAPWPELILTVDPEPLPPAMPRELIPEPLRDWVEDVCERMCVAIEMVATAVVVALAALVGRRLGICPKGRDNWLVVPNLWGGVVARPGLLKTPAIAEGIRPLRRLAKRALEDYEHERAHADERIAITKIELAVLEGQLKASLKKATDESANEILRLRLAKKKEELDAQPRERRYITQDGTIEKIGELLHDNPRGLLQLRDELAGWLRLMDHPGRQGDRQFYLEAWNGTGSYTFDRIGRGTIHILALTLSVFGGITPGALRGYIGQAMSDGYGADGLLQRLQLLIWPGTMPEWRNCDRLPNAESRDRVDAIFERLDSLDPAKVGAVCADDAEIPYVRFSPEAQELFDAWREELEHHLRSHQLRYRPAFESHIAKYRSLMPSLALLFHLVAVADAQATDGHVTLRAARLAAAWCEYLESHAERVYASEGPMSGAGALANRIEQGDVCDGDDLRTIYRRHWSLLDTTERVMEAAKALERLGWIRLERGAQTGGRPSSPRIRLHPDLRVRE